MRVWWLLLMVPGCARPAEPTRAQVQAVALPSVGGDVTAVPRSSERAPVVADPGALAVETTQRELGLAALGTSEDAFVAAHPECDPQPEGPAGTRVCRIHRRFTALATDEQCQDGCTWRTYTFAQGALSEIAITRDIWDADGEFFARFRDDALILARALDKELGAPNTIDRGDPRGWSAVEAAGDKRPFDQRIMIERRQWHRAGTRIEWWLGGAPGHHAGAIMHILVDQGS